MTISCFFIILSFSLLELKKKCFVFGENSYFIFYSAVQDNQVTSFNSLFFVCVLEMLGFDLSICLFEYQLFKVNILYSLLFF